MIIHVIKGDPTGKMWEAYSEDGKLLGVENRLSIFRNIHKPKTMHRGINLDKAPVNIRNVSHLYPHQVSAWWYNVS